RAWILRTCPCLARWSPSVSNQSKTCSGGSRSWEPLDFGVLTRPVSQVPVPCLALPGVGGVVGAAGPGRSLIAFPCGGRRLAAALLWGAVPRRFPGGPARRVDHGDTTGGAGTGDGCEFVLTGPYGRPVRLHIRTVQHLPHAAPLVVREQCHQDRKSVV